MGLAAFWQSIADTRKAEPAVGGPVMSIERCNHTSVGIIVQRDDRLLLIERGNPPYGWAAPAGHVDPSETYAGAAARELREEVGLSAEELVFVHAAKYGNRCRRPGGDHHVWRVYRALCGGDPVRCEVETRAMRWVTPLELRDLIGQTRYHLAAGSGPEEWQRDPGLEPVWWEIFTAVWGPEGWCCAAWPRCGCGPRRGNP